MNVKNISGVEIRVLTQKIKPNQIFEVDECHEVNNLLKHRYLREE